MKTLLLVVLVYILTMAAATQLQEEWKTWKKTYNKVYESPAEEARRHGIWMKNRRYVTEHNQNYRTHGFTLAMNKFGDHDQSDMKRRKGLLPEKMTEDELNRHLARPKDLFNGTLPDSVDWREKGAVLQVKDQGQCGSCWSFGITGTIEGQNAIQNNIRIPLSEQNLIDCSWSYGNSGCDGGRAAPSYKYIINNGGIDTEASYPYTATDTSYCNYNTTNKGASISDYKVVSPMDEMALMTAIANIGPISVSIDASQDSFQLYNGTGIYYEPLCSTTSLDHMVLAVGYGSENGNDYYIVKNSWGSDWGAAGYLKMARNRNNNCGIATLPTYPIM